MSQYGEYEEENLRSEREDSHHDSAIISDDPETHTRRRTHQEHLERTRSSDSGPKERKRHLSKSELQRQLSRQVQYTYIYTHVNTYCIICYATTHYLIEEH